ncbi:hypothetical protein BASA60_002004 [Batrachochytrium salamandrivorans]|nr:hypothetical protein BASA60_002004 [Batrachochytrium salamandrivorans]
MQFTTVFIAFITAIVTVNAAALPVVNDNAEQSNVLESRSYNAPTDDTNLEKRSPQYGGNGYQQQNGGNQWWGQGGNQQWNQGGNQQWDPRRNQRRKPAGGPRAAKDKTSSGVHGVAQDRAQFQIEDAIKQLIFISKS